LKRLLFLLLIFIFSTNGYSQSNGNEWIDYTQSYYRIKVVEDGIYRINKQVLVNAGIPVSGLNPKNFRIFGKEKELSIYVKGEIDGSFDENDFIEFVAQKNNGWLDSLMYNHPQDMLNPEYSLINDTLIYYLTWNNSTTNLRAEIESAQNFDSYPLSPYCWVTETRVFKNNYVSGKRAGQIHNPLYTVGEGYGKIKSNSSETIVFNTAHRVSGSNVPAARFQAVFASANNPAPAISEGNHHLRVQFQNNVLFDAIFMGFENFTINQSIASQLLSNESTAIFGSVNDIGLSANDSYAIGYAKLKFAHDYNFESQEYFAFDAIATNGFEKLKVEFENFEGSNPVIYAIGANTVRIQAVSNGNNYRFLIPQNGEETFRCYLSSAESIHAVTRLSPVSINAHFTDYTSLNLSNAFILITADTLLQSAQAYLSYRSQIFNTLLVDVEQLYDQYGGGIAKHPLAIKRFINDLLIHWDQPPTNLFLFGKSIHPSQIRNNPAIYAKCFVPTMGFPASDNLLTAGLNGTLLQTAVPTGRLAAKTNQQAFDYLDKVIQFESQPPALWMKEVLHFGGGGNTAEQTTFANYLSQYETTISDTSFGANVTTVLKNTSAPIQINITEDITARISQGVSMMAFFGHAFGSGFDINIDAPQNYDNYGKYPLILASSCFIGDVHTTGFSNSEEYVLIPEKGSIAYIASTTTGVAAYLHAFNKKFHKRMFQSDYGKSIGYNLSKAVSDIQGNASDALMIANNLELTLHGDPSIVLNSFEKPDYSVVNNPVFFEPEELTADVDSFTVNIPIDNLGRATHQLFNVELIRHFPGGNGDSIYVKQVSELLNTDTITFTLAAHHALANGINTFDINVDVYDQVDETDNVGNNLLNGVQYNIKSAKIVPLYPYTQAIISEEMPKLSGSTGNYDLVPKTYQFQISPEYNFSSGVLTGQVTQGGGVVQWQVPSPLQPQMVYYWRLAELQDANIGNWRTESFQYIPEKTGWGQSNSRQFSKNQFNLLNYLPATNQLDFLQGSKLLTCRLFGHRHIIDNEVKLDLDVVDYGGCPGGPYVFVMVFNDNNLEAWENNFGGANPEHDFGNTTGCRQRVEKFFAFNQNSPEQLDGLYGMLSDAIPNGYHILVYSYSYALFEKWSEFRPDLFTLFQNLGASQINVNAPEHVPFIFYVKKGTPESAVEEMGTGPNDTLFVSVPLPVNGSNGSVTLVNAGFTGQLTTVDWGFDNVQNGDLIHFSITQESSNSSPVFETENNTGLEQVNQNTDVFLPIEETLNFMDTIDFTPLQFNHIHLLYTPVGDAALNPSVNFELTLDTLQEGALLHFSIAITNPTPYPLDSLTVQYSIVDNQNNPISIHSFKLDSLRPNQSIVNQLTIPTLGLSGDNSLVYLVNPLNSFGQPEQAEQHRFNNEIRLPFYVISDLIQPVLDVVFDGMHIMNGEIVSPNPLIAINLKDENDYLVFEEDADTTNIAMFITPPSGLQKKVIFGQNGNGDVSWVFDTNKNRFGIQYTPDFTEDGTYKLLVQARDKSGNLSGKNDFEIEFEVINKSAITQVINYPNPFTTKTHFVFTLTGSRIPDVFTIRIYTISGQIVKEIHKDELGNIHIGNNITDYFWDGTDMYGDRLANGVYFYQVTVEFRDAEMNNIETNADKYFKSGMGKMYLFR